MSESGVAPQRTVAVIGSGFSGLMTALQLLGRPDGPRVRLIERRPTFARGAAYSTSFPDHLLNVRASNMSAFPDRPDHFVRWLEAHDAADIADEPTGATAFARRSRYGAYLQAMLADASESSEAGRLLLESDAIVDLEPHQGRWRLTYDMGRQVEVDAVVLAVGNFPPHLPSGLTAEAARSPAFLADPWAGDLGVAPETGTAVVIGTGLTMVDLALRLSAERPDLKLLAISRRGLLPHRHLPAGPAPQVWEPRAASTVVDLLRAMRAAARGADWRSVIDGLRPHVQSVWRTWPDAERRRFLRHARPWWEIHRHRLAPAVAERIDTLIGSGALTIKAGRFSRIDTDDDGLVLEWRPKGRRETVVTKAALVINGSGPSGQLARSPDPLIAALARRGLVRADRQDLGLDVDPHGRLVAASGAPSPSLFSIGPVTRGAFWEITSVPDIRVQAAALAGEVCAALERPAALV